MVANNDAGACTYGVRMGESSAGLQTGTVIIGNVLDQATSAAIYNALGTNKVAHNLGTATHDA